MEEETVEEGDDCPVCLEPLPNDDEACSMPTCGHRLHVRCLISAARYDARCPLCRFQDPLVRKEEEREEERGEEEDASSPLLSEQWIDELEREAAAYRAERRRYMDRRRRMVRSDPRLIQLEEKISDLTKRTKETSSRLERRWSSIHREVWRTNPELQEMKRERRLLLQRLARAKKSLQEKLLLEVGEAPYLRISVSHDENRIQIHHSSRSTVLVEMEDDDDD